MTAGNFSGEHQENTMDYMSAGGLKDILGGNSHSFESSAPSVGPTGSAGASGISKEDGGAGAEGSGDIGSAG